MTDVGDVHDVLDAVAVEFQQRAAQQIFEDVGAQVADMSIIVDGWTAGIEADLWRMKRDKFTHSRGNKYRKVEGS